MSNTTLLITTGSVLGLELANHALEYNDYYFISIFQILHKFILWTALNLNHAEKEILGNIVSY